MTLAFQLNLSCPRSTGKTEGEVKDLLCKKKRKKNLHVIKFAVFQSVLGCSRSGSFCGQALHEELDTTTKSRPRTRPSATPAAASLEPPEVPRHLQDRRTASGKPPRRLPAGQRH